MTVRDFRLIQIPTANGCFGAIDSQTAAAIRTKKGIFLVRTLFCCAAFGRADVFISINSKESFYFIGTWVCRQRETFRKYFGFSTR
jgi:hypothetical protein